jgi:hypothetical protein
MASASTLALLAPAIGLAEISTSPGQQIPS